MQSVDFLPERIRLRRARRRRLFRQGYLLAAFAVAVIMLGYVRYRRIDSAQGQLAMLGDRAVNIRNQLTMRQSLEKELADLMIKKRIDETLGSRVLALDVLGELERLLPESMALTKLAVETVKLRAPAKPVAAPVSSGRTVRAKAGQNKYRIVKRIRLVITGLAPTDVDVANFIGQLSASPLFEDINMGYAKNAAIYGRTAREFQASCYVVR